MVYSAVLVSGVLQSQSVMHMHISTLSSILFPYTPLQGFEQDFLRYTAGPYQSSISSIVLCIREEALAPTPVLLPGKSHGQRSLLGCSPWGRTESGTTERLHFHFSLSCIGDGNGNPLQCSCLENPRERGAWWAAVYGVAQSQTRLK